MSRRRTFTLATLAVLLLALVAAVSGRSSAAAGSDPVAYSFIGWGDIRPGSQALHASYTPGWQHVRDKMAATPHAFEVVVGDMINVAGSDTAATIDGKYADFFTALGTIKSIPRSYAIGNHEAVGTSAAAAASWEKNIRPGHYAVFTYGAGTAAQPRIVVLNLSTYEAGHLGIIGYVAEGSTSNSPQADWLVGQLRAHAQDAHTFLVVNMHHPIADSKPNDGYDTHPAERQAMEALFAKYGVDMVLAGHVHAYVRHMMPDGTPYVVQGMAGADPMTEGYASHSTPGTDAARIGSADSTHRQYGFTRFDVTTTGRLLAETYVTMEGSWTWRVGDSFEVPQQAPAGSSPAPTPTGKPTVAPTPTATPTTAPVVLVSQGRRAAASSRQAGRPARYGNDGRLATRWTAAARRFPQWWRVDLGRLRVLSRVRVRFYDPASSPRTYAFRIQCSRDRTAWRRWAPGRSARYLRVYVTGLRAGRGRASIVELRAFVAPS